jgi:hypothetical protein
LLQKVTLSPNFQFNQAVVNEFRLQLGTLLDNLSSVYLNGKVPKRRNRKSASKKPRTTKVQLKKKDSETKKQNHKKKAREKEPEPPIVILPEDLHSDTDSIINLLTTDPFVPSPQKTACDEKQVTLPSIENNDKALSSTEEVPEEVQDINKALPSADNNEKALSSTGDVPVQDINKALPSIENIEKALSSAEDVPVQDINKALPSAENKEKALSSTDDVPVQDINKALPSAVSNEKALPTTEEVQNITKALPSTEYNVALPSENISNASRPSKLKLKRNKPSLAKTDGKTSTVTTDGHQSVPQSDGTPSVEVNSNASKTLPQPLQAKRGASRAPDRKPNTRQVLSGNTNDEVKPEADPFIGKPVAFGRNTTIGNHLIKQFGEKFDERGICFDLDSTSGHIVGTVMRINKQPKSKKQVTTNYNVVWEFTAFGETDLALTVLLDGQKEGDKLIAKRIHNRSKKSGRPKKSDASKLKFIKENLSKVSDDEAMQVSIDCSLTVQHLALCCITEICVMLNFITRHQVVMSPMIQKVMNLTTIGQSVLMTGWNIFG